MTSHLTPDELIDLVEERLTGTRAEHAEACERCRTEADALRALITDSRRVRVPEPSPLFWQHQARRIVARIKGDEASPARTPFWARWRLTGRLATGAVALVLVAAVVSLMVPDDTADRPTVDTDRTREVAAVETTLSDEPAWRLLLTAADAVDWQSVDDELWAVDPGAVAGAVSRLSADERRDLVQLLEAELEGSSL